MIRSIPGLFWLKTQDCHCLLLKKWDILAFFVPGRPAQTCEKYASSAPSFSQISWTTARSSTGVLMWEVYSEGRLPYDNRTNSEVVETLNAGLRLLKPRLAPDAIYLLMEWCWKEVSSWCSHVLTASFCWIYSLLLYWWQKPEDRPCFTLLLHELASISWPTTAAACSNYKLNHIYFIYWVVST